MNPEVQTAFIQECMILHENEKECALTFHLDRIAPFYIRRIGIGPVLNSWEEMREMIDFGVRSAKEKCPEGHPFVVRLTGGNVPPWLLLKIYTVVVYLCDSVFYIGDLAIRI